MTTWMGRPVDNEVNAALAQVEAGVAPGDIETQAVDFKEEDGRRDRRTGAVLPPVAESEPAAQKLAPEVACMASTPGGGALIVGVADDGQRIGSGLRADWLRHRLYELLDRKVTAEVTEHHLSDGHRLLIIRVLEALEPILYKNKLSWRMDDNCVEVSIQDWWARHPAGLRTDPSAQLTAQPIGNARPAAVALAREWLSAAGSDDLAQAPESDLLTRLGVATDGYLTVAGVIAFVGTGHPTIDYQRRAHAGGDSTLRIEDSRVSALEAFNRVLQAITDANPVLQHQAVGPAMAGRRQITALPQAATREVLVNALSHRDWNRQGATVVEHIGNTLVVISPGGFVGGVNEHNILTRVSARNQSLRELFQKLNLAEREGVGVDRMIAELVATGRPAPAIHETAGPAVRVELIGGDPDMEWVDCIETVTPQLSPTDVDAILILDQVTRVGWIDVESMAPVLQTSKQMTETEITRVMTTMMLNGTAPLQPVDGIPLTGPGAWRPGDGMRALVPGRASAIAAPAVRDVVAMTWALHRGRISTTELGSIVGITGSKTNPTVQSLEADGRLRPSRERRVGPGFYYLPVEPQP